MWKTVSVLVLRAALAACAKPLPPERAAYVGEWRAKSMVLHISPDGNVSYKRQQGNSTTSINAPLKAFSGNDFVVGVGPMETTFVVSAPPRQREGGWTMTVDGVELVRGN